MNLRIVRQRLGLRQSSGAFGWLACIAKAPPDWRTKTWRGPHENLRRRLPIFNSLWRKIASEKFVQISNTLRDIIANAWTAADTCDNADEVRVVWIGISAR